MRYTTTDGPNKPLNAIQEGSLGDKMGIAGSFANRGRSARYELPRFIAHTVQKNNAGRPCAKCADPRAFFKEGGNNDIFLLPYKGKNFH